MLRAVNLTGFHFRSIFKTRNKSGQTARQAQTRRRERLQRSFETESLEARIVLTDPGMPMGTLGLEHQAMAYLSKFEAHHTTDAVSRLKISDRNYFVVARDATPENTTDQTLWSNTNNWLKYTYNNSTSAYDITAYNQMPSTGDDVRIPAGLEVTYDITPGGIVQGGTTLLPEINMRLHTVDISGTLKFEEMQSNVLVAETVFVAADHGSAASGSTMNHGMLVMMEPSRDFTDRIIIAAPNWYEYVPGNASNYAGLSLKPGEAFNPNLDPFQFGRSVIAHGMVMMDGADVAPFVTVQGGLSRFSSTSNFDKTRGDAFFNIGTSQINGWRSGDRIVIAGTDPNAVNSATGASSDEEAVIQEIVNNADGTSRVYFRVSTLLSATNPAGLQRDHLVPVDPATGLPMAGLGVQIANLSRNISIQSENPYHTMARGHVMFMHTTDVDVQDVGFYGLGRTDKRTVIDDPQFYTQALIDAQRATNTLKKPDAQPDELIPGTGLNARARYAVHFHRAGIDETDPLNPVLKSTVPANISGSAVVDSPGWGIVNHTSYVNVDNNVAFNVVGSSFVGEAGNELGRFVGNLAIKGVGANTNEGIESRKVKQDFGFQGDGFWFQGPGLDVRDNIAVSQKHDGFVFFTRALEQKYTYVKRDANGNALDASGMITTDPMMYVYISNVLPAKFNTTMFVNATKDASAASSTAAYADGKYTTAVINALGGAGKSVNVGDVPILRFLNNTAYAAGTGFESWFHQLNQNATVMPDTVIENFTSFNQRGSAMFDPYTNNVTVKNGTQLGRVSTYDKLAIDPLDPTKTVPATTVINGRTVKVRQPGFNYGGTSMARNTVTANFNYDNVTIRGYDTGIDLPINGDNVITGGTFQNSKNLLISTANSRTRSVTIQDGATTPVDFIELTDRLDKNLTRLNISLQTSYNPKHRDISKMFNPDVVKIGTVWLNAFELTGVTGQVKQLYYYEQAAAFKPFPGTQVVNGETVPIEYGKTIKDEYGNILAYTGIEVPPELIDLSNAELMDQFGLSIGGVVAPANAINGMGSYTQTVNGVTTTASPLINGLIGNVSTYQDAVDVTSAKYTRQVGDTASATYNVAFREKDATGDINTLLKKGNFLNATGYKQFSVTVNGVPFTVQPPATGVNATNYYGQKVAIPIRAGWNLISGNLDNTGANRTLLVYGDITNPNINVTSPDPYQLRRATVDATGQSNGYNNGLWTNQFVAVMHTNDLDVGFAISGMMIDNSFGTEIYRNMFKPAQFKDSTGKFVIRDDASAGILDYANYKLQKTGAAFDATKTLRYHLDPISFTVKDWAGNVSTFQITIYLDDTAPRTGGSAIATGSTTPSASLISLLGIYVIDDELRKLLDPNAASNDN